MGSVLGGISGIVGGALGALGGSQSQKARTKSTSGINLGGQGSLENLLYGGEVGASSQTQQLRINELNEYIKKYQRDLASATSTAGRAAAQRRLDDAQNKLNTVLANPDSLSTQGGQLQSLFQQLSGLANQPGAQQDISAGRQATLDYANLLQNQDILPSQQDISSSNQFAQNIFAPQQTALNQLFQDQVTQSNRNAARMGRSINDPILANKLAQEQARQTALLQANQGSYASQLALQLPSQRLNNAMNRANALQGLSTQALNNRLQILGLGQQLGQAERNFRLQTSQQYGNNTQTSGGGLGGAIAGGLGGAGAGFQIASGFNTQPLSLSSLYKPSLNAPSISSGSANPYSLGNFSFNY